PEECQMALASAKTALQAIKQPVVIVHDAEIRPWVRQLFVLEFPGLPVLSEKEFRSELHKSDGLTIEWQHTPASYRPSLTSSFSAWSPAAIVSKEKDDFDEVRITVYVSAAAFERFGVHGEQSITERFSEMQEGLFNELGLLVPEVQMQPD